MSALIKLRTEVALESFALSNTVDANNGRVANELGDVVEDLVVANRDNVSDAARYWDKYIFASIH